VAAGARRPKVYFEEWDSPHISAIRWVSELIGIAGGDDCFPELAAQSLGKNRIIADGAEIVRRNPTSSWAPGAARNSGPRTWWRVKAGMR
jgi:iron complex transport system substrate-binding protein